ncbi:MAG: sporulation protein YqfD [Syntrophomonadaceae bacterium]|mgnify:CR=1 FL=1|jgi:similar to stage IV sporulation protein|nr:sporulation protein YqfD [Syntrophomonadaceae bacterium]
MSNRFLEQFGGVITIIVQGRYPERLINMALTRGIYIWNIKPVAGGIRFEIRSSGYEALRAMAEENGYQLKIVSKHGLPVYKSIVKRRVGFMLGGVFFIIALYLISSFVWFIEITGNERIDSQKILDTVAKYGVYQGAPKWGFSRTAVEEQVLRDIGDLSYIKIEIRGVKANIEVVEKIVIPPQEIIGPSDMVAARSGIVEEILVLDGQAKVEVGQVVAKGDVLISGTVIPSLSPYAPPPPEPLLPYQVQARGVVKARVWYDGYGECPLKTENRVLSGRKAHRVILLTPWRELLLWGKHSPFANEQVAQRAYKLDTPIGPLGLNYQKHSEETLEVVTHTEAEATQIARQKALESLQSQIAPSSKIIDSTMTVLSSPSDAILRVKVSLEVIEDIAVAQPINKLENSPFQ